MYTIRKQVQLIADSREGEATAVYDRVQNTTGLFDQNPLRALSCSPHTLSEQQLLADSGGFDGVDQHLLSSGSDMPSDLLPQIGTQFLKIRES